MNSNRLFFLLIMILPLWVVLNGCATAQNKEEKKEKKEEEEVVPAPVEAPEESGSFEKGFNKEMPDEGGLGYSPDLLLATFSAKANDKGTAMVKAMEGAKNELSQQIELKLEDYQKTLKKEKLKNQKEVADIFSNAGKLAKNDLLQKPVVADSSVNKIADGWEASVMLELKVTDLDKKIVDLTKDNPEFKKTKLYQTLTIKY